MIQSVAARLPGVLVFLAFGCVVIWPGVEFFSGFRHTYDRGRFVLNMAKEHEKSLRAKVKARQPDGVRSETWAEKHQGLRGWLVSEIIQYRDPKVVLNHLENLTRRRSLSPRLKISIERWKADLKEWAQAGPLTTEELLALGRRTHFLAEGFTAINNDYDATVRYLQSNDVLLRFIELSPNHIDVPEALYLIGKATLTLRSSFPPEVRSDRILNLCNEYFPGTIWAKRAGAFWRREINNGV